MKESKERIDAGTGREMRVEGSVGDKAGMAVEKNRNEKITTFGSLLRLGGSRGRPSTS